ncbi:beta-glucosidase BglX [Marivirga sp. S37H4]|uniref:beta-glucosidase n=1 Tax=Marivirga aurantiaca TaxID=2802615 RepID=A0A934WWM4_9BACT|nr:beta-glucosidase BglX [Marivirga aurantiaca]MBK6264302.1 beta-glucosidase BglX [Marivirga aurantiaca]
MTRFLWRLIGISFAFAFLLSCSNPNEKVSSQSEIDFKVDSVLSLMTLEEKIGQLNQYSVGEEMTGPGNKDKEDSIKYHQLLSGRVGSVLNLLGAENTRKMQKLVVENSRLGIPLLFSYDVVHGYKTIFPIPLAESASWNLELMQKTASISAKEAAASGLHWTFAPMVDVSRDARWGRVMEGAGEDPYLGAEIAKARILGFQGDELSDPLTIAATAKHFAGYGFVESGKDYNSVNVNRQILMNQIIPPFKAANEVGVATFMNAFNDIDGTPATSNNYLLRDLLKGEWKFSGVVVSDWNSIGEIVNHGTAIDLKEASQQAINAGTDIDMEAGAYIKHLKSLIENGSVSEEVLNDAVRRVLKLKYDLGLFDDPYRYSDTQREKKTLMTPEFEETAKEIALESIVLLKNDQQLLPIQSAQKIAVIGPLAKDKDSPLGNWRAQATAHSAVSLYEGLNNTIDENTTLDYAEGVKLSIGPNSFHEKQQIEQADRSGFEQAKSVAKNADVVIMALGETAYMSGEGRSRADIGLPGLQLELLKEIYKVNTNIILVLMNGRPLTLSWEAENIPAILETWHLGSQAGNAIADVLVGNYNPSGKLSMSFPRTVGQLPMSYNHKNTGRPTSGPGMVFYTHHNDVENSPLFPFGYGLSYTDFEYGEIQLNNTSMAIDGSITASIEVKNVGRLAGKEIVQLYIQDVIGSTTRPIKELKAFQKELIEAGQTKTFTFKITAKELSFYREDGSFGPETGTFRIFIGNDSATASFKEFTLK